MTTPLPFGFRSALVFGLVLLWKLALLLTAALPPPSNDSFFYDGAVVNLIRHGSYANPSIALALPISGTQVFSAYPPLYQWSLLPWMCVFGTSELSAMFFHLLLFSIYAGLAFAVLSRLSLWAEERGHSCPPAGGKGSLGRSGEKRTGAVQRGEEADNNVRAPNQAPFHIAGLFLLAITFHDRPDSLAHVFGLAAVYAWVRFTFDARVTPRASRFPSLAWPWVMAVCGVLALGTGLQIGALYIAVLGLGTILSRASGRTRFPWGPMAGLLLIPVLLVAWVISQHPLLWHGFTEHARLTPAITGLRFPRLDELLKIGRAAPGIFAVAALSLYVFWRKMQERGRPYPPDPKPSATRNILALADPLALFLISTALPVLGVLIAAMFFITPNAGSFTMYLQPVIVGAFLFLAGSHFAPPWRNRIALLFAALALFASIRAFGLSTWGLACAADCSRSEALARVRQELTPPENAAVISSAYLYEASRRPSPKWIHCDWLKEPGPEQFASDLEGLRALRPGKLILTQFDYFRRYEALVKLLREKQHANCIVTNTAGIPAPDSFPPLRRVLQHVSWAPVIITLDWSEPAWSIRPAK